MFTLGQSNAAQTPGTGSILGGHGRGRSGTSAAGSTLDWTSLSCVPLDWNIKRSARVTSTLPFEWLKQLSEISRCLGVSHANTRGASLLDGAGGCSVSAQFPSVWSDVVQDAQKDADDHNDDTSAAAAAAGRSRSAGAIHNSEKKTRAPVRRTSRRITSSAAAESAAVAAAAEAAEKAAAVKVRAGEEAFAEVALARSPAAVALHAAMRYHVHPSVPLPPVMLALKRSLMDGSSSGSGFGRTSPRATPRGGRGASGFRASGSTRGQGVSSEMLGSFFHARQAEWKEAFIGLFTMLKESRSGSFHYRTPRFSVLFTFGQHEGDSGSASGGGCISSSSSSGGGSSSRRSSSSSSSSGSSNKEGDGGGRKRKARSSTKNGNNNHNRGGGVLRAVLSPSTKKIRSDLGVRDVFFTMPFLPSWEGEVSASAAAERAESLRELKELEDSASSHGAYMQAERRPLRTSRSSALEKGGYESTLLFEGLWSVEGLFDYLLCGDGIRKHHPSRLHDVPELLSSVPFPNSSNRAIAVRAVDTIKTTSTGAATNGSGSLWALRPRPPGEANCDDNNDSNGNHGNSDDDVDDVEESSTLILDGGFEDEDEGAGDGVSAARDLKRRPLCAEPGVVHRVELDGPILPTMLPKLAVALAACQRERACASGAKGHLDIRWDLQPCEHSFSHNIVSSFDRDDDPESDGEGDEEDGSDGEGLSVRAKKRSRKGQNGRAASTGKNMGHENRGRSNVPSLREASLVRVDLSSVITQAPTTDWKVAVLAQTAEEAVRRRSK